MDHTTSTLFTVRIDVVVVVVVVVRTLTRIIKSVVTGQAPVTLEWRNTPGKKNNTKAKTMVVVLFLFKSTGT